MNEEKKLRHHGIKPALIFCLVAGVLFCVSPAGAVSPVNTSWGVALKGHDAVAYFTESKPIKGSGKHEFEWMGARWRFSSAENRDLFAKNPENFAPQYGGYCAYAVSQGITADIDPEAWKIVDGRLYLNQTIQTN